MNRRKAQMVILLVVCTLSILYAACAPRRSAMRAPLSSGAALLQKEIVGRLSGAEEIRPGIKLAGRFSPENKQEARNYLAALLERMGMKPARQAYSAEAENVYAILPCGRPDAEAVVLGAHYDTVRNSPGANDNATGVALVAAAAQELVRVKNRSRDTIFVFFDEEERGLRGSKAFAQMLQAQKRAIHSVHTVDQMGWDQDGDRAIELELPYNGAVMTYTRAAESMKTSIPILTSPESGSDHSAFRSLGMNALGITEEYRNKDTTPFIHRAGDTYETVNFEYLALTTRLVVETMKSMIQR
jgi:Zn-dependent M28 family amino/carboxypeptidase